MKKFFVYLLWFSLFITQVSAVSIPNPVTGDFLSNFNRLTDLLRPLVTLTFLGVFFLGGYEWMVAGDDADKVKKAGNKLLTGTIGSVIIFIAPSVVDLIGSLFGVDLIKQI